MPIFILTNNVEVDINMLKLLYTAELVDINLKYIASNASVMMSLSVGYLQISASGYPDSKFTIPNRAISPIESIGLKLYSQHIMRSTYNNYYTFQPV